MNNHKPILRILLDAGHQAYFVGGCVRDHLLGRECKDIDITTSATPDQVAALFPDSKLVGAHFGVVIVKLGELEAEVATFRTDGCYSDSRRPDSVEFTTDVIEDLKRRDFTINAILMDVNGHTIDPMGGVQDLKYEHVKAIGDPFDRFTEDPLRMLRAVRFCSQLEHFSITKQTAEVLWSIPHLVKNVSVERVQQEFSKMLTANAELSITNLSRTGLLDYVIPEFLLLRDCNQNPLHHPEGDVYTHTLGLLRQLPAHCSLTLALAALLHDIGKPATFGLKDGLPTFYGHEEAGAKITEQILRRLKYPNEVIDKVVNLVAQHMTFRYAKQMRKSKLLRFIRQENFAELLELHRMDATAGSGNLEHYEFCLQKLNETPPEVLRPERLVTGQDLIEMGLTPGPEFKKILDQVEESQLEGIVTTREGALIVAYDFARTESRCPKCGFAAMDATDNEFQPACGSRWPHFTKFYPKSYPTNVRHTR